MSEVLHITPHLGGGVGRALASLVAAERLAAAPRTHTLVCLEAPEKTSALEAIRAQGARVLVAPPREVFERAIAAADLVQVEFWNHPATLEALCGAPLPAMRLLVWCHVSGLQFPRIPAALPAMAERFVLTSPCSWRAPEVARLPADVRARLRVISSAAGMESLPEPVFSQGAGGAQSCRFGYLGSLNFAKLHPHYPELLSEVTLPDFRVRLVGDVTNRAALEARCASLGQAGRLVFAGFREDVVAELRAMDVLLYLLNPCHYGTAEIALLEAMAMGVVPVVMAHPAELQIVDHGLTGLVVRDAGELAAAVSRLARDADWRRSLGERASAQVRARYTASRMAEDFAQVYAEVLGAPKRCLDFGAALGREPGEWFAGFVREAGVYRDDGGVSLPQGCARHAHLEPTKGSARHFARHFPDDPRLREWAAGLQHQTITDEQACLN